MWLILLVDAELYAFTLRSDGTNLGIQEMRKVNSDNYDLDNGYSVYLSGVSNANKDFADVGFVISPRAKSYVLSFSPISNRISILKLKDKFKRFWPQLNLKDFG